MTTTSHDQEAPKDPNNLDELKYIDKPTTPIQLALDVFNKHQTNLITISDSNSDIGYRRSNRLITVSDISLETKRLFDVAFYLASQNIEENSVYKDYVEKDSKGFYSVDLGFMKWLLQFKNSRNDKLRKVLKDVQKITYQFEELNLDTIDSDEPLEWSSYTVFPSITLSIPRQRIFFQINSLFEEILQNTHKYQNHHFLSLCHIMPTIQSKLMYDWILSLNNPSDTFSITIGVTDFKKIMGIQNKKIYKLYGELNRRFIMPGIDGINKNSNFQILFTPLRNGSTSRVTDLFFEVSKTYSEDSEHQKLHRFMQQYKELQTVFGLQASHFEEIHANKDIWTETHIEQAKNYVLLQIHKGINIKSIAAYYMDALRNGYKAGELELALMQGKKQTVEKIIHQNLTLEAALNTEKSSPRMDAAQDNQEDTPEPKNEEQQRQVNYEDQVAQGWTLFEKMDPFNQMEAMELFRLNPYTQFVLQAEKVEVDNLNDLSQLIFTDPRLKKIFGIFIYKKEKQNND